MRIHRWKFCRLLSFAFSLWLCGEPSSLRAAERAPMPQLRAGRDRRRLPRRRIRSRSPTSTATAAPTSSPWAEARCAWYENPSWKKRVVTTPKQTPGIISSATADLDGDGKAEVAIAYEFAMNEPTKGKLLLATQGKGLDDPWTVTPVADVGSIHRLRWGTSSARPGAPIASPSTRSSSSSSRRSSGPRPSRRPSIRSRLTWSSSIRDPTRNRAAGRRRSSAMPRSCTRST